MSKKTEARERVKAMREEQARRQRRRERALRFGIAGAVVAAVAIVAVAIAASRGSDGPTPRPDTVTVDGGGIMVGDPDAPVTIDYWMDFLCPHCQEFEAANAGAIDALVEAGDANIVYHPLDFTGDTYSRRANNAFACAADEGSAAEFVDAAFAAPEQWTSDSLRELGDSIGVSGDYSSCVGDGTYEGWAADVRDTARDAAVTGTPTVFVDGETLPNTEWTPDGINAAVAAAAQSSPQ
ncbi:DsbA family protein [Jiangella anatolica]|uniref:Phosphoesterase n=1 Tax=Jiangella anatolica TaxID=2670374 RepID=A0A2W2CVW0_9ACTN|nr:thioredoxin domain-containing protein [Jiangella anatolica]PZF84363.1 phosphoesterase [Jiangella anatolica]